MIEIAFFRADAGEVDDWCIDRCSGGQGFSHCEFVVDSQTMIGSHYKAKGIRVFKYNDIYHNPNWEILQLDGDYNKALEYAMSQIGKPYDALGAVMYFIGLNCCDSKKGQWCSEFANNVLLHGGSTVALSDSRIMPNHLYSAARSKQVVSVGARPSIPIESYAKELDIYGRIGYATTIQ